ncbi:uncharacterized protein LOC127122684 [Lathyrus oleraceus]|uniref:uncharacterized protein LOC127122684 n=1 Tax=Pisum sativum TaxID=3888 RepID=UPI0021CFF3C0|nr:uncharacterized protein LOC127122684 [Pisum sativum]
MGPPGFRKAMPIEPKKSNLELLMKNSMMTQTHQKNEIRNQNLLTNEALRQLTTRIDDVYTHNKKLETQISQVAQQKASTSIPFGSFPRQPEQNPKGHLSASITHSGKCVGNSSEREEEVEDSVPTPPKNEFIEDVEKEAPNVSHPPYKPIVPFPQRLVKAKVEAQFKKFVELLKKIHLNVSFTEALTQITSYVMFLKEILSNKRKPKDHETMTMTLDSNVVIQNMVIPKLKYMGSSSIPYQIGTMDFERALCDLGASVSLMHLYVCKKLDMGEMTPTIVSLHLVNRSVTYPIYVLEDVPVRAGEYYVFVDFVIMEIDKDYQIPIILGRPFLSTERPIIDVKRGKLTFEVGEEKIKFILAMFLKNTSLKILVV